MAPISLFDEVHPFLVCTGVIFIRFVKAGKQVLVLILTDMWALIYQLALPLSTTDSLRMNCLKARYQIDSKPYPPYSLVLSRWSLTTLEQVGDFPFPCH